MSTLAADVESTEREVGATLNHVTAVGMVASLASSGVFGYVLSGHDYLIAGESVLIAIAVDYALFRWLRISKRLRKAGAVTAAGKALDRVAAGMTFYLNGLAGIAPLIPAKSPIAYVLLTIAHVFIPTMMLLSYIAMPGAQLKLQEKLAEVRGQEEAERNLEAEKTRAEQAAERARADKQRQDENVTRRAEAADRTKCAEIDQENRTADLADKAAEREARFAESVNALAGALLISSTMQGTSKREASATLAAETAKGARAMAAALLISTNLRAPRQRRSPARRQAASPGSPASFASPSPGVRQPTSPARRQAPTTGPNGASPQVAPDVAPDLAMLVKLAKPILAADPGIGRSKLAKELAITPYYARRVLDEIDREKEAQVEAELQDLINRAIPQNADGENGGTADGQS